MPESQITSLMRGLPENATNAEALAWVANMRRIVDRWDALPDASSRSMTPELRKQAHEELDAVERSVHRNMALPEGA